MVSWREARASLTNAHDVELARDDMLLLRLDIDDGPSQLLYLWHRRLMAGTEDWLVIESPVIEAAEADLAAALNRAGDMVFGAVRR